MTGREKPILFSVAVGWISFTILNGLLLPGRYAPRIAVETVKKAPMALIVRAPGTIEAKSSVTIKAPFDGELTTKNFREGQRVRVGEILGEISRDKIQMEHQAKEDALTNAKSDLAQARKEVLLQKSLFNKQAVAYSSVEDAKRSLVKATQALRTAEESWKLEEARWKAAIVKAPLSGTIVKDAVADDRSVTVNKEILTIADVSEFSVKARVDELDIKRMTENQTAEVRIQIYPDKLFKARLVQIGAPLESSESTAIGIVLKLEDTHGVLLRPKLTADVRILTEQTVPIVTIPLTAIHNADGTTRVWVLGPGQRLHQRKVTLGRTNPERAEVTAGLQEGEQVCVVSSGNLADGMRVALAP